MRDEIEINATNVEIILCLRCFLDEEKKVVAWLKTKNFNLGGFRPIDLINSGRAKKVLAFIEDAAD